MKKDDVVIGNEYQTKLSGALQTVKVQARIELEASSIHSRRRVVFACLTPSDHVVRRSAAALRVTS